MYVALDELNAFKQRTGIDGRFFDDLHDSAMDVVDAAKMIAGSGIKTMAEVDAAKQRAIEVISRSHSPAWERVLNTRLRQV